MPFAIILNFVALCVVWNPSVPNNISWSLFTALITLSSTFQGMCVILGYSVFEGVLLPENYMLTPGSGLYREPWETDYCLDLLFCSTIISLICCILTGITGEIPRPFSSKRAYFNKLKEIQKELKQSNKTRAKGKSLIVIF
jgi:hypothetical protein